MPFKVHLRRIVAQILKYKYRWHTRKSFIPIRELLLGPDRIINKGPFAGKPCYYKTGLLNTLIALRPQICLEIGTYYGGTKKKILNTISESMNRRVCLLQQISGNT
jgi:hypothetical protein